MIIFKHKHAGDADNNSLVLFEYTSTPHACNGELQLNKNFWIHHSSREQMSNRFELVKSAFAALRRARVIQLVCYRP